MRPILITLTLMSLGPIAGKCQTVCQPAAAEIQKIRDILARNNGARTAELDEPTAFLVNMDKMTDCLVTMAAQPYKLGDLIKQFENTRDDQQEGSSTGTGGSTTVVAKGPVAEVISVATEYGAVTQSVSSQTVTVKGNLANVPYALVKQGILPVCALNISFLGPCAPNGYLTALSRFSFGVSFDTSRGSQSLTATPQSGTSATSTPQQVVFQAQNQQISQVTGRVELLDHRDISSQTFQKAFIAAVKGELGNTVHNLAAAADALRDAIDADPGFPGWQSSATTALNTSPAANLESVWLQQMTRLVAMLRGDNKKFDSLVAKAQAAYGQFFAAEQQTIDQLAIAPVIAVEYTDDRPLGQPDVSTFRLIIDKPFGSKWKFIANGAVAIYNTLPTGTLGLVKRFRDAQAAAELSYSFGQSAITGPAALSLAGYYQDQRTAAVLNVDPSNPILGVSLVGLSPNAKTVLAQTGNIELVQLKLTLGGTSAVKVPFAMSYSNRTDLVDKPDWKAQIGITYNLDSLFSK